MANSTDEMTYGCVAFVVAVFVLVILGLVIAGMLGWIE